MGEVIESATHSATHFLLTLRKTNLMKKLFTLLALVFCGFVSGQNLNLKLQQLNNLSSEFGFSISNGQLKIIALIDSETQMKGTYYLIPLTKGFETSMTYVNAPDEFDDTYLETFTYHIAKSYYADGSEGGGDIVYESDYGILLLDSIRLELGPNFDNAKRIYLILNEILR